MTEVPKVFRFEGFALDEGRGCVLRAGQELDLRPKALAVLEVLVHSAGRLVSKDEILERVWPNVTVTEDSLVRCIHELRRALSDRDQRIIRTVPRRGYLFDVEVAVCDSEPPQLHSAGPLGKAELLPWGQDQGKPFVQSLLGRFAIVAVVIIFALIGIFYPFGFSDQVSANAPQIAVLPFANLSGDPQQEYFSDGVVDDLITNLSRFPELSVVARNSSFSYRGTDLRAATIGRELGARYLLAGSVRRDQDRLRVNVQLVDAQNEKQLWAKSYDEVAADVFVLQNSITQEIVANLASGLRLAEARRVASVPANTLSAYQLVLRARELSFKVASRESTMEARDLAKRAVRLDPSFAAGHIELGRTYYRAFVLEWEGGEALDRALKAAQRSVALEQNSAGAQELLGRVQLRQGRHGDAIQTLEKAIALNVNRAESYASLADALTFAGRPSEAIPLLRKAMRLDPFYAPRIDMYLGRALYFSGNYDEAVAPLEACAARAPQFRACYMYLGPVYAELDRHGETQSIVARLLEISPEFSVSGSVRDHLPYVDSAMQKYTESLLKAGVPET